MAFSEIDETQPTGTKLVSDVDDAIRETRSWIKSCLKKISGYPDIETIKVATWTTSTRPKVDGLYGYNSDIGHFELIKVSGGTTTVIDTTKQQNLDGHPIGSLYFTMGSESPATIFGGSWSLVSAGTFLMAADSSTVGRAGGAKSVTLSVNNLPRHSHSASSNTVNISGTFQVRAQWGAITTGVFSEIQNNIYSDGNADDNRMDRIYKFNSDHSHTITIKDTGDGVAFDILPPYLCVYMWRRTA